MKGALIVILPEQMLAKYVHIADNFVANLNQT
jgi:hypothetical protein